MSTGSSPDLPIEQAVAGDTPQCVRWYGLYFDDERWEWSPEV